MEINAHGSVKKIAGLVGELLSRPQNDVQRMVAKQLEGATLEIGPSSDSNFGSADAWGASPIHVDRSMVADGMTGNTREIDLLLAKDPSKVGMRYKLDNRTGKYVIDWAKAGVRDADTTSLITGQLLSPNSVGWFQDVARRPLLYSNARKMITPYTGTDPWAEVMSLGLEDYSGFASLANAGSVNNNASNDVEVTTGLMSSPIINMNVTYKLSVAELERAKSANSAFPFGGQLIAHKQAYARWVLDTLTDSLIYYGNSATGTVGLITVNGATSFNSGTSLTDIANGASTTKGHDMYLAVANVIATFLNASYNMLKTIKVAMSPLAYNLLTRYPYSDTYNPQSAIKTFMDNFLSGQGKYDTTPDIEIVVDPMLSAGTIFNTGAEDYMVISCPEIAGGPDDQPNALTRFGMPIPEFVYPVVPGQYNTPYKTLRRVAGVFAPYTPAVAAYSGFGV